MDSGHIGLIILAALVSGVIFCFVKLFRWFNKRCYVNMLRGNLREDYIKNNPHLTWDGNVTCACGGKKIVLRNLGPTHLDGVDIVREHVCHRCGKRLFMSASGAYLEGIVQGLKRDGGYAEPEKAPLNA